jgi:hypothetical protein
MLRLLNDQVRIDIQFVKAQNKFEDTFAIFKMEIDQLILFSGYTGSIALCK